ncbi:hypothetical protein [Streptomyces spiramenti]|uniref:Uncharacterized protein n=1 Tax=Streptomyces spiramenti TaxID=2720606 RepID=A0ABX1AU68_9ACTN|nr:hypothetical protein [Streptomyces spiramenti]NJP68580.1 hypothetical protein [Streptomyces spiramenti]
MNDPTPGTGPAVRAEETTDGHELAARPDGTVGTGPTEADDGLDGPDDATGPRPLGLTVEPTGDATVDALLARLSATDHLGVAGHQEVYEDVHGGLRDALAALDRAPGPTPRGAPHPPPHPRS